MVRDAGGDNAAGRAHARNRSAGRELILLTGGPIDLL